MTAGTAILFLLMLLAASVSVPVWVLTGAWIAWRCGRGQSPIPTIPRLGASKEPNKPEERPKQKLPEVRA